jgi:hypothetical protein
MFPDEISNYTGAKALAVRCRCSYLTKIGGSVCEEC